jgi:pimeloyl-ACP methyl ester carboxylesterase
MPTVHVRGIDLYYEEHGTGPNLLFAHGLMSSVALAPRFGERIEDVAARGVHVVAYDARGHGRSGYTTKRADYSWSSQAEDMHGLIQALGLAPTSIYGGSMGAATAMLVALDHPSDVDRLILRAPPGFGATIKPAQRQFAILAVLFRLLGPALTARIVMMTPSARREQRANPNLDLRSFFASQRRASIVPAIQGVLSGEPFPVHRLDGIRHPTLILAHPDDPIHPLSSAELLHERLPHAKLAVAPSATYWQENPSALTHVVAAFVRGEEIARGLPQKVVHEHVRA